MLRVLFRRGIGPFVVLSIATLWAPETSAQSQSLFGNRGPLSQRGGAAGNSSLGGSSFGRTSQAGAGFGGQSGIGSGATGGLGGNRGLARGTGLGATGGMAGNGFVGRNGASGNFVGRRTAGQQNVQTTNTRIRRNQTNRRGQNGRNRGNFQNTENARNSGARTRLTRRIRPLQRIAFSHPVRTDSSLESSVRTRFESLSGRYPGLRSINADLAEAGQLTLRGEVDTVEIKRLAEAIVRLEPGVRVVRNELLVTESDSSN